jgi:two-component system, NarL family, sensor kinase
MRVSAIRRTQLLFALLIAVLLLNTYFSFRAISRLVDSENWLAHTYTVLSAIDSLEFRLQDSQTAADDFVITGEPQHAQAFRDYISAAGARIELLQELTSDNSTQQAYIAMAKTRIAELDNVLRSSVEAREKGTALQPPTGGKLQSVMEVVGKLKDHEADLLRARSERANANLRTARNGLLVGSLTTALLLVLVASVIVSGERNRVAAQQSQLRLAAIVDSTQDAILSKTLEGKILSWNQGAEALYGYSEKEMVGEPIYKIIPTDRQDEMKQILQTLSEGRRVDHLETVRCRRDGTRVDVDITVSPLKDSSAKVTGASAIARDISQRKKMEESLRQLSARILNAQDEERRRIARDIHDSTVQKLALLSMNLSQAEHTSDSVKAVSLIHASRELSNQCAQELRSLSYVLHPPMLEELGLASALKIYGEGFSQRSGIELQVEVPNDFERLPPEMEIALFRVAQESLSNIMRHSKSPRAKIKLARNGAIELGITDEGKGFTTGTTPSNGDVEAASMGVGILGMSERMKQLGGTLRIDSGPGGTSVSAHLPYGRRVDGQDPNRHRG